MPLPNQPPTPGMPTQGTDPAAAMQLPQVPQPQPDPTAMPTPMQQPVQPSDYFEDPEDDQNDDENTKLRIRKYAQNARINLAEKIEEEKRQEIGQDCKARFDIDFDTTKFWRSAVKDWIDLALQAQQLKNFPWDDASNVKYPLVSVAAMQFSARAYPTLVPSDGKIVKPVVYGKDENGKKVKRAERVARFMSWQLQHDMDDWEEDTDRLLLMVSIMGTIFRKTYYDVHTEKIKSELVDPREITINYFAKSIDNAQCVSEHVFMYKRDVIERQRSGMFRDVELQEPSLGDFDSTDFDTNSNVEIPHFLIQQHCWLDLDGDKLTEPYIVTFERTTGEVLSIYPRFFPEDITVKNGRVVRIKACSYYTKYGFIPNPESRIYDIGFGHLLGPINETVNTLVNQLVDAGTLSNLQSGFIGKGLRLAKGEQVLRPGQWKQVNAFGDDLRKQIVPLPAKEPSNVLFQLLGYLVTAGKELASVAEIFVGKMPGQNTPATTTMASIEQGMKVFTAIYKRIYKSLQKEFNKVYFLNSKYLDYDVPIGVLDETVSPDDFDTTDHDIIPGADPTAVSSTERLLKAQGLMELLPLGTIDPMKVTMRILEAQEQPNWEELVPGLKETGQPVQPQQPPDPKLQAMEAKAANDREKAQMDAQNKQREMAMKESSEEAKLAMQAQSNAEDRQHEAVMQRIKAEGEEKKQNIFIAEARNKMALKAAEGQQGLQQKAEQHQQNLQMAKESAKSKSQGTSGKTGSSTRSRKK